MLILLYISEYKTLKWLIQKLQTLQVNQNKEKKEQHGRKKNYCDMLFSSQPIMKSFKVWLMISKFSKIWLNIFKTKLEMSAIPFTIEIGFNTNLIKKLLKT